MKKNQITELLEQIKSPNNAVELYILAQPEIDGNDISVKFFKARMQDNLETEIIELFYPIIEKRFINNDYDILAYDPAVNPDRKVIWEQESEDVPFYNFFHNLLEDTEVFDWYDDDDLSYDEIWAYWIKIYGQGNTYYLIKKVTPSKIIKTGGKLAVIFDTEVFKKLENDVLTMDGTFDAIYSNNSLIFENKMNFERALLYENVKQKIAEETLNDIKQIGFVENFEQVKDFLKDDYHSINKLNKIKSKPYFRTLTFTDCKRIIQDYNVGVGIDNANNKFNITSKAQAKYFIKVLNDDYLKSEMTNVKYAANSKEDV